MEVGRIWIGILGRRRVRCGKRGAVRRMVDTRKEVVMRTHLAVHSPPWNPFL